MTTPFDGRKVLLVEDESLVAMLLETILEDMGCTPVGPASNIEEGKRLAETETDLSCALLDVNVSGQTVFAVAEALQKRGIPFVFSTGYGESGLPDEWRGRPTIQKPFTEATVRDALMAAMGISAV